MTAIAWPAALRPTAMKIRLATSSIIVPGQRNPWAPQVIKLPVQAWLADLTFRLGSANVGLFQGHVAGLDGPAGVTTVPDWDYDAKGRRGTATGTITATGTKDGEAVLLTGGSGTLLVGDRLGIAGRVHMVAGADVTLGGSVVAKVRPQLRADCSAAAVTLTALLFPMRQVADGQNEVDLDAAGNADATVRLVEDLTG